MHELSIALALLEQVQTIAEREKADTVSRIAIRIGGLSGVNPEALELAFPIAAADTCAAGAALDITYTPAHIHCRNCGQEGSLEPALPACEACGSLDAELEGGRDLLLTAVEIESAQADPANTKRS